jgi:DNA-binding NarL/FixJ family response regulator
MNTTAETKETTIWLIEDNADYRRMVTWQINQISGLNCVRNYSTCEEALAAIRKEPPPQVLLCDVGLPGMDGITGISAFKAISPSTHVIMLTVHDDHRKVLGAICAGASGYLLKDSSEEAITAAIHEVLNGGAPMNGRIARLVLEAFARQNTAPRNNYRLSAREKDILQHMVKGMIKKEIAEVMGLSYHTVNNYLRRIYDKLHVHTRGGAVAKALEEKLLRDKEPD